VPVVTSGFFQIFEKIRPILKKASQFFEKSQPAGFFQILPIVSTLMARGRGGGSGNGGFSLQQVAISERFEL
jgi:hypothetical protein